VSHRLAQIMEMEIGYLGFLQGKMETSADIARNEAPRSKLRGITELNFEDFSEAEANPVASYGECSRAC